jgi:type IV secretory pathway TraG/TraD family ATPase VirD4
MEQTPIGITNFRNNHTPFGIKEADRFNHIYCIGKTGTGKSTLLLNMAINDIKRGNGICLIDPHGDIAKTILEYIPKERLEDVIYLNPNDEKYSISFNPLYNIPKHQQHLIVSGILATFKKIWIDSWGPRLEYIFRYTLLTLFTYPEATLLNIQPILTNTEFRKQVLRHCSDQYLLSFWQNEFNQYSPQQRNEAISPILNKTGVLIAIEQLRMIIGQSENSIDIEDIMNNKKILICNLSKGTIGEDATTILGSMIVNAIQVFAMKRAKIEERQREPFYLYVDEMQSFISLSFADILAEARKYKLSLFLTHQYLEQIHEKIRFAILGNVGTIILFRIGAEDAKILKQEVHPPFTEEDLINLPKYSMYIKLMIDGATSKPFSAITNPLPPITYSYSEIIKQRSNEKYGRLKRELQEELKERYKYNPYNQNKQQELFM